MAVRRPEDEKEVKGDKGGIKDVKSKNEKKVNPEAPAGSRCLSPGIKVGQKIQNKKNMQIIEIISLIVPLLVSIAYLTLAERKVMGSMQRRLGPNKVGILGVLQP